MPVAYLDTQIAIHLFGGRTRKLSREATRCIDSHDLLISPMVYLEFDYLLRIRRVTRDAAAIYAHLNATIGVTLCPIPFATVAALAVEIGWTTDPFDRIIVAQAQANQNAPLISSDTKIAEHYARTIW